MSELIRIKPLQQRFGRWVSAHYFQLAVFNLIIILLVLLRSAEYFKPFFPLTINLIIFIGLLLSIFLLGTKSWFFFVVALIFWSLAALFKVVFRIDVWAERAGIYTFESLVFGTVLLIVEKIKLKELVTLRGAVDRLLILQDFLSFLWKRPPWKLIPVIVVFIVIGIVLLLVKSSPLFPIFFP